MANWLDWLPPGALLTQQLVAHEKSLTLALEVPPQVMQVDLNADLLGRVVDNLVSNAHKFTPVGGRITIALQKRARCC